MGRVSVVTGGTSGIGRGIVEKILSCSKAGDLVFVNYAHNEERAQAFVESLPEEQKKMVRLVKADMSSYEAMMDFVAVIKKEAGVVDWLVCNAGISTYAKYEDYT
ncbi:short chain dehydrogenase/reductase family oxidoreductase, partial [gut metagenome]